MWDTWPVAKLELCICRVSVASTKGTPLIPVMSVTTCLERRTSLVWKANLSRRSNGWEIMKSRRWKRPSLKYFLNVSQICLPLLLVNQHKQFSLKRRKFFLFLFCQFLNPHVYVANWISRFAFNSISHRNGSKFSRVRVPSLNLQSYRCSATKSVLLPPSGEFVKNLSSLKLVSFVV